VVNEPAFNALPKVFRLQKILNKGWLLWRSPAIISGFSLAWHRAVLRLDSCSLYFMYIP